MKNLFLTIVLFAALLISCNSQSNTDKSTQSTDNQTENTLTDNEIQSLSKNLKPIDKNLPTIGILMYDKILMTELTAPVDVFSKQTKDGKQLFNVITIAENYDMCTSEEGLKMFPDYTFENLPDLNVIFVPSTYEMTDQINNKKLIDFIITQNGKTDYTVSNCAGATLIGESGIADGHKIVTWVGGGTILQENYPNLKVQNDSLVSFIEDGKFMSSNGNLASYISSLELLERLSNKQHRDYVESRLYLERLQNWKK